MFINTYNILTRGLADFADDLRLNEVLDKIQPPAGTVYYVESNVGDDTNDGLSWTNAFKTLAVAFVASNASIALASGTGWAARNKIYVKSDNNEAASETIITLPNKCDVIGVGSYDAKPFPEFIGNHVIGAGAYMGTRFINVGFRSLAAGGAIFTVPTTTSGLEFIGCNFDGNSTIVGTYGIVATAIEKLKIIGCNFRGLFSVAAISLGTGSMKGMEITDNFIESGAIGILVNSGLTCTGNIGRILRNVFSVVTLIVDENSDTLMIGDNKGATESDGTLVLTLDYNAALCFNNMIACTSGTVSTYPILTAAIPT